MLFKNVVLSSWAVLAQEYFGNLSTDTDNESPVISSGDTPGSPVPQKSYFTTIPLEVQGMTIPLTVFKVDFDRNLYLTDADGNSIAITDSSLNVLDQTSAWPVLTKRGSGKMLLIFRYRSTYL